jgi:hypothetical protein
VTPSRAVPTDCAREQDFYVFSIAFVEDADQVVRHDSIARLPLRSTFFAPVAVELTHRLKRFVHVTRLRVTATYGLAVWSAWHVCYAKGDPATLVDSLGDFCIGIDGIVDEVELFLYVERRSL